MSVLLGPADADHYRVKVGRFNDRFYTDPLPACPLADADDGTYPSISTVKKASGQDWSYVALKRVAKALTVKPDRFVGMTGLTEVYDRVKSIDKVDKEAAFARGNAVHRYAEDRLRGVAEPRRDFAGGDYFDSVDRFLDDHQPELDTAEVVAINRTLHGVGYGGTLDALVVIDRQTWIVDWKGLSINTPIPTPDGWSTMGALAIGDLIFGSDGRPTVVTAKSEVHWNECYRIKFDDGTAIIADHEHRWNVRTRRNSRTETVTTEELASLKSDGVIVRVALAGALNLPDVLLPVDPYVLGVWLGDGSRRDGTITKPLPAMWDEIGVRGYRFSDEYVGHSGTRNVYGLIAELRSAGVLHRKHIPDIYLRAAPAQRLDLLRGLMDTDGNWNHIRHHACIDTVDKALAEGIYELVMSLGWRASRFDRPAHGFGVTCWRYRVSFRPLDTNVFIARDNAGYNDHAPVNSRCRYVHSVERVPTVPTQCITVDADDELYLAGESMIPTHNSRGDGSDHGAYPEEAAQLGGYSFADYIIVEGRNGPERRQLPELAGGLIISIKSDGYRVYPIDLPDAQDHWMALHSWWVARRSERVAVGRPWAPRKTPSSPGSAVPPPSGEPAESTALSAVTRPTPTAPVRTARRGGKDSLAEASDRASAQHRAAAPAAARRETAEVSHAAPAVDIAAEGGLVDEAAIAELGVAFKALDDRQRAEIDCTVIEARDAGVPITLHGARTLRRYHIARGLIAWEEAGWTEDDICYVTAGLFGGVLKPVLPLGGLIGALDHQLAADWADLAVAATLAERTA